MTTPDREAAELTLRLRMIAQRFGGGGGVAIEETIVLLSNNNEAKAIVARLLSLGRTRQEIDSDVFNTKPLG